MKPTQLTLNLLRKEGWTADICERWISFGGRGGIRKDLFGFADVIAFKKNTVLLVNPTTQANAGAHVHKYRANPILKKWIRPPHRNFIIHAWSKKGPRGRRKVWDLNEVIVT